MSFIPRSLAPFERYPEELAHTRVKLGQILDHHVAITHRVVGAGGQMFDIDLWVMGVSQRSFHLLEGFLQSFDAWNVTVAAPIVRFQIENLYRTRYLFDDPNRSDVIRRIMNGESFRNLKAHDDGARLTDQELVKRAGLHYPWLPDVYEASNEWVHMSNRHVRTANRSNATESESINLTGRIPLPPEWIDVNFLAELLGVMREATLELFDLFNTYEKWKLEHPTADSRGTDIAEESPRS